ncbi:MAG: ADP-forming succinate--CoA ligase subunit beta [Candidatus Eisenbacteria bacterium]|nr:ADP-forming succinate--CoA ligase subunit beta [Candidatus Eisenbacteria bacterium]
MNIHEYQAKEIFARYGIPVPPGKVAASPAEAGKIARDLGKPVVVKAQVHVGGRGKAGGIKFGKTPEEAEKVAGQVLGMSIKGLTVKKVLVTTSVEVASESYLGLVTDRKAKRPVFMASPAGGVDIEEVARTTPEKIFKMHVDPCTGLLPYQARFLAGRLEKDPKLQSQIASIAHKLWKVFWETDCSLAEINPLVKTPQGEVIALDAKINLDDNGLFRHAELEALREGENEHEKAAREMGLSYVKLDGSVGCCVNGAGLAMATMDLIKHYGGEPANFLDIGGSSSPDKVLTAMRIICSDPGVKAVFFNIFGGITRCDDVASGIVRALKEINIKVPIVIRLTGTNEEKAREILRSANLTATALMDEGVRQALQMAKGGVN